MSNASLRRMRARYRGRCRTCKGAVIPGQIIYYDGLARRLHCEACGTPLFEMQHRAADSGIQPDPPSTHAKISKIYFVVGLSAILGVLFCIGLLSDRMWPITLLAAFVCAIGYYLSKTNTAGRWRIQALSFVLLVVAAGSAARDYWQGGLFDHPPAARCADGTFSYSQNHQGTCSWHRGVAVWNPRVPMTRDQ
jgi:hypothetical protein